VTVIAARKIANAKRSDGKSGDVSREIDTGLAVCYQLLLRITTGFLDLERSLGGEHWQALNQATGEI
jgi:hypothetical protein